jgi:hypothetical protein
MKPIRIALLSVLLACCSSGIRPPEIFKSYDKSNYLFWSSTRKLNWDDFKGIPEGGRNCRMAAILYSAIDKTSLFGPTGITAAAIFDKNSSWIENHSKSTNLLLYNRIIFDIYELHARKLRKEFENTDFSLYDRKDEYYTKVKIINDELSARISLFESESGRGTKIDIVLDWEKKIKSELDQFIHYIVLF